MQRKDLVGYCISIHALREEGDSVLHWQKTRDNISIHALREEGDTAAITTADSSATFLSTPSARRATYTSRRHKQHRANFYPRPPRGGRQQKRRKISPLLFHYKTICTDLEELVQKHPKKQLRSAQNGLKTWCEGDGKR